MDYKDWLAYKSKLEGKDLSKDEQDYDLESYFKSLKYNDKDYKPKQGIHLEDTYKKPNHPTFSDQSMYHIPGIQEGGSWKKSSIMGYPIRDKLYQGEDSFFKKNPNVTGMAAEDNSIILNPYSTLNPSEKNAVAKNEAIRLYMRNNNIVPSFESTRDQDEFFKNTAYDKSNPEKKQTIVARILSGDPSISATQEQIKEANRIMESIGNKQDKWAFKPSELNLRNMPAEQMQRYFSEADPNAELDLSEKQNKIRRKALEDILKK